MADAAEVRAAGAVLWRPGPGDGKGPQIALVHRPRYDDWSFPKGKCLPGEHVLVTAVREVSEETGVRVVLGRRLVSARYTSDGLAKRVDYWAARPGPGHDGGAEFVPNAEVDDLVWLPPAAARARLTYPHDAAVLDCFAAGPADSTAVILLRHGIARSRKAWRDAGNGCDLARPLTGRGRAQARALAEILRCFSPARVISSRAERCLATVRPYAALAGSTPESEPAFTVGDAAGNGEGHARGPSARERIGDLAAACQPAVVCAHRENMPSLLAWACERLGAPVPGGLPLRKGAFWVLQVGDGRLVSAEQHDAPGTADTPAA